MNNNDYNYYPPNYYPPVYTQPAAPVPSRNGSRSLLFGIMSIALNVIGTIVFSISFISLFGSLFQALFGNYIIGYSHPSDFFLLIGMIVFFGLIFNIAGLAFSLIAAHTAGSYPTGKALGGKVTGIIGLVLTIMGLIYSLYTLIFTIVTYAQIF